MYRYKGGRKRGGRVGAGVSPPLPRRVPAHRAGVRGDAEERSWYPLLQRAREGSRGRSKQDVAGWKQGEGRELSLSLGLAVSARLGPGGSSSGPVHHRRAEACCPPSPRPFSIPPPHGGSTPPLHGTSILAPPLATSRVFSCCHGHPSAPLRSRWATPDTQLRGAASFGIWALPSLQLA